MTKRKPTRSTKGAVQKPRSREVFIDNPEDRKGKAKAVGGSQSDSWNQILANQACHALWTRHSDEAALDMQHKATLGAMVGIAPRDELEGMMAAQLIAAHNAAMECYRRAMLSEQTLEGWRENLNQANKLSRTWATLQDALDKHRGKGQQNVTVKHVHVYEGGQAIVGAISQREGGKK